MTDTTRISDLPENIKMQTTEQSTTYSHMNVHPNPYGNSQPGGGPMMDDNRDMQPQFIPNQQQQNMMIPEQPHTLPSRDIPMDTTQFSNDRAVTPNYMPKVESNDFIGNYEQDFKRYENYERKKHQESIVDSFLSEFQLTLMICSLFFFFQLPVIHTFIVKYFSFLNICYDDGNVNFNGMCVKTLLFGSCFYFFQKFTDYLIII